jgi:hypothetical protein
MLLVAHCGFHHDKTFPWFKCCQKHVFQDNCFCSLWKTLNHENKIKTESELVFMVDDIKSWKRIKTESCHGYHEVTQIYHDVVGVQYGFHHGNKIHDPIIRTIGSKLCTYHSTLATLANYII